jgi:hypothetical protein
MHVTFGHDRTEIIKTKLMGGEGEAKIGLRERGDRASKGLSHGDHNGLVCFDGDESAFVEVDGEPSNFQEGVEDRLQVSDMERDRANNDESIVRILKDGAWEIIN